MNTLASTSITASSPTCRHAPLILHPRCGQSGHLYDVECDGELIVRGSRDPEPAAARALLARGITGKAVTIDARTGKPRLVFDIERMARLRTSELEARFRPFEPMASCDRQGASQAGKQHVDGAEVAAEHECRSTNGSRRAA